MVVTNRLLISGFVAALSAGIPCALPIAVAAAGPSDESSQSQPPAVLSSSSGGKLYCDLPEGASRIGLLDSGNALGASLVIHLDSVHDGEVRVDLDKRTLYEKLMRSIPDREEGGAARNARAQFSAKEITSSDDLIVSSFEQNSVLSHGPDSAKFFGFKILIDRSLKHESDGTASAEEIYLRIIINGTYKTQYGQDMTAHRAAYVLSKVISHIDGGTAEEKLYRFFPSGRPFWMIACVLKHRTAI